VRQKRRLPGSGYLRWPFYSSFVSKLVLRGCCSEDNNSFACGVPVSLFDYISMIYVFFAQESHLRDAD
jgi:hypothetical protein